MANCIHCGALRSESAGLFCAYCGKSVSVEDSGPRLLEAISIETKDDVAHPAIIYGARVPTSYSDLFSTATDRQETIHVHLLLGNSRRASQNRTLANLVLPILARAPTGEPRVQLTIAIDAQGHLRLRMEELGTNNVFERADLMVPVSGA